MKFDNSIILFSKADSKRNLALPTMMSSDLAEEIGLHVGDGSMNFYKNKGKSKGFYQLRGHSIDDKLHYYTRIKFIYKYLYNLDISLRYMPSTGVIGFQIWSDALVQFKQKVLGLCLGKKTDIMIPKEILADEELSKSFLRGFYDTDGCLYIPNRYGKPYPRVEINSVSKSLMYQIKSLLLNMGFKFSLHSEKRERYGWNDLYRIQIKGRYMAKKWFSEIRPANPKHLVKFLRIIEEDGPGRI